MSNTIRVLVADDSPTVCRLICSYLENNPDFEVVGQTHTGMQTIEAVRALRPDVVTLDFDMPDMDGIDALDLIMKECPTPVIMLSGLSREAAAMTLAALQLGAVEVILKYAPGVDTDNEALRSDILTKIRIASRVKVIRSLQLSRAHNERRLAALQGRPAVDATQERRLADQVVVIGASTGGPVTLREVLVLLPPDFQAAVIVVQHMPATFTRALAAQLDQHVAVAVREAGTGDMLYAAGVLIAPGDHHLVLDTERRVQLHQGAKVAGHRPSIDVSMKAVVNVFGLHTSGVLLTGMGCDGVAGLQAIREQGGTTYAQDTATCVVDGMPRSAIERGLADYVLSPAGIAQVLREKYSSSCNNISTG